MQSFEESRQVFTFDENWRVVQWDKHPAYAGSGGFQALSGITACDFIAVHAVKGAHLFEVKNFIGHHGANKGKPESGQWAEVLAGKMRDTLAGIIWARGRAHDRPPLRALIGETLNEFTCKEPTLKVVIWVDDRPPLDAIVASNLRTAVQRHLRGWLGIRDVRVVSCALHARSPELLPGLTVTRLP